MHGKLAKDLTITITKECNNFQIKNSMKERMYNYCIITTNRWVLIPQVNLFSSPHNLWHNLCIDIHTVSLS